MIAKPIAVVIAMVEDQSKKPPASSMVRVPTALIPWVRQLSDLHRAGHTSTILTGLQQLIASVDSNTDISSPRHDGKCDSEVIAELIARVGELEAKVNEVPKSGMLAKVIADMDRLESELLADMLSRLVQLETTVSDIELLTQSERQTADEETVVETTDLGDSESTLEQSSASVEEISDALDGDKATTPLGSTKEVVEEVEQPVKKLPKKKNVAEVRGIVEANLKEGQRVKINDLAKLIDATPTAIRERFKSKKLFEWGLKLVPRTRPQEFERIS